MVLDLEDIDLESLLVVTHGAKDDRTSFVNIGICEFVLVYLVSVGNDGANYHQQAAG